MPAPVSREKIQQAIDIIHECLSEGFVMPGAGTLNHLTGHSAFAEAAKRIGTSPENLKRRLETGERRYGLKVDPNHFAVRAPFTIDALPHDGEPTAEELITSLKRQSSFRLAHEHAKTLRDVRINIDGPIGVVFFGDPHVDSNGTDWTALERDVSICRNALGIIAVNVGDTRDNWVGRLMKLYANQDVTAKQALKLIEWLFTQIPWLLTIGGNHDQWGAEHGDAAKIIHEMHKLPGLYEDNGARLRLLLPSGANFNMHVRHDFPGSSQFNGAHAMVRETLFGFRDHVMACGHRHSSAYQAIWHNDPPRLCHGIRTGSYKRIDNFAKEKHFKNENWAPSMGIVVDPTLAHDPVRFIERCFSAEEVADKLTWARTKWERGRLAR